MSGRPQSYASHRRLFPLFHYALALLVANTVVQLVALIRHPRVDTAWAFIVALAITSIAVAARAMALVVQNRVIRLEMRLRLMQVLPPDLRDRAAELNVRQLVSLRFASDAELPGLVRRCLAGELSRSDEIKQSIRDWQPDYLRA